MLHNSKLGEHAEKFPADLEGNVPEPGDHWSKMKFDHGPDDPDEEGISEEERNRRIKYLDEEWWPKVLADVAAEREKLDQFPGGNPIHAWRHEVMRDPPEPGGFEVE